MTSTIAQVLLWCIFIASLKTIYAKQSLQTMQAYYKKIADGLIDIRKEYPASQSKIYGMLDQLEKFHVTAKGISVKKDDSKQRLQALSTENNALKQELAKVKSDVAKVKQSIEEARTLHTQSLADEQKKREDLELERKALLEKIIELEHKGVQELAKNEIASRDHEHKEKDEK